MLCFHSNKYFCLIIIIFRWYTMQIFQEFYEDALDKRRKKYSHFYILLFKSKFHLRKDKAPFFIQVKRKFTFDKWKLNFFWFWDINSLHLCKAVSTKISEIICEIRIIILLDFYSVTKYHSQKFLCYILANLFQRSKDYCLM